MRKTLIVNTTHSPKDLVPGPDFKIDLFDVAPGTLKNSTVFFWRIAADPELGEPAILLMKNPDGSEKNIIAASTELTGSRTVWNLETGVYILEVTFGESVKRAVKNFVVLDFGKPAQVAPLTGGRHMRFRFEGGKLVE